MKRLLIALALVLFTIPAQAQQAIFRQITGYKVNYTGTVGTASQAVGAQSRSVRVMCTSDCFFAFPVTPIVAAATRPIFLPASKPEYFKVSPGTYGYVIRDVQSGTLYITEVE